MTSVGASLQQQQPTTETGNHSPVPSPVPTSSSEVSFDQDSDSARSAESSGSASSAGRPGETSPSSICCQRRMSAAVVTEVGAKHEFLQGRPKIIVPAAAGMDFSPQRDVDRVPNHPERPISHHHHHHHHHRRSATAPTSVKPYYFIAEPEPLREEAWGEPPATDFKIRGRNYLTDRKKVTSAESAFKLMTVDMIGFKETQYTGLCSHPNERVQKALRFERETGVKVLPEFIFAVNLILPAPQYVYHCMSYFAVEDKSILLDTSTPLGAVAKPFFFGESDDFRDKTFKLIPRIVEGNFVLRKAVGTKPALLGTKVKLHYIRHERYFELIIDVGSESVAERIVKLAIGSARSVIVDMMFVLEGTEKQMLPERILGGLRLINVDFNGRDGQRIGTPANQL